MSMNDNFPGFDQCIQMIRSDDAMTYEDGYHSLLGRAHEYTDKLIQLMQDEKSPDMRGKFIELLGDTNDPKIISLLALELENPERIVRQWAFWSLEQFDLVEAGSIVEKHRQAHPEDDF
jgi:HEAT repeat protein